MKILITGFDPFGEDKVNASMELVHNLPDEIAGISLIKRIVPTAGNLAMKEIQNVLVEEDPDYIISIGQAAGRKEITIERVGINIDDYRIPDNAGMQLVDQAIVKDGPDAYLCTMPLKQMIAAIQDIKIPAAISDSAGTFVCNHVCYATAHLLHMQGKHKQSCFIHVPILPNQAKDHQPSMDLHDMVQGVIAAISILT